MPIEWLSWFIGEVKLKHWQERKKKEISDLFLSFNLINIIIKINQIKKKLKSQI